MLHIVPSPSSLPHFEIPPLEPRDSLPFPWPQLTICMQFKCLGPDTPPVYAPLLGRGAVKTHQASPTAFMGFLPLFLGMYSSSGERGGSGSSLLSGELWLCSALVLFWEALLAVAPERIPVNERKAAQYRMREGRGLQSGVTSAMKNPNRNGKIAIEVTPLEATSTSLRAPHPGARTASFAAVLSIQKIGWEGLQRDSPETYV